MNKKLYLLDFRNKNSNMQ